MGRVSDATPTSMKKFLREVDSTGGYEGAIGDEVALWKYIFYCYSLNKPRKLSAALVAAAEDESTHGLIIDLFKESLIDRRSTVVEKIEQICKGEKGLSIDLEIAKSRHDVSIIGKRDPTDEQIQRLNLVLNSKESSGSEQFGEFVQE